MERKTKAVYAGSFDPLTEGHLAVIIRAGAIFDELVIAVGHNPDKHHTFSVEKRVEMIEKTMQLHPHAWPTGKFTNYSVTSFDANQFLVNYAREIKATHIVRGLRNAQDFEAERTFFNIGLNIQYSVRDDRPIVETVYIITPKELEETSSSMVKKLCGPEGWKLVVHGMVPGPVFKELETWVETGKS